MDISDEQLIELKKKLVEKLERYMKLKNECTDRTIDHMKLVDEELKKRNLFI